MGAIASQITSLKIVYSNVYSDTDQRKHQSSVSLAFVWGIHRGPVNSPHKWPVTRKMFPFDDVIMENILDVGVIASVDILMCHVHTFINTKGVNKMSSLDKLLPIKFVNSIRHTHILRICRRH